MACCSRPSRQRHGRRPLRLHLSHHHQHPLVSTKRSFSVRHSKVVSSCSVQILQQAVLSFNNCWVVWMTSGSTHPCNQTAAERARAVVVAVVVEERAVVVVQRQLMATMAMVDRVWAAWWLPRQRLRLQRLRLQRRRARRSLSRTPPRLP